LALSPDQVVELRREWERTSPDMGRLAVLESGQVNAATRPGRLVRYVMPNGDIRPAVVVRVYSALDGGEGCTLSVFRDSEVDAPPADAVRDGTTFMVRGVRQGTCQMPGTWH
jgi:hypothetical protein